MLVRGDLWQNTAPPPELGTAPPETQPEFGLAGLLQRLAHRDANNRLVAAGILGRLGSNARPAIPHLLAAAVDVDPGVRKASAAALEQIDPNWPRDPLVRDGVPRLVKELGSRFTEVWQTASLLLVRIGEPAVDGLIQALNDGDKPSRQVIAARVAGRIGPAATAAVPALARGLGSEHSHVRQACAEALAGIGPAAAAAIPPLVLLLGDWQPMVRAAAARSLARVGRDIGPAAPALIQLLADREPEVREAAAEALTQAGPEAVASLVDFLRTLGALPMNEWLRQRLETLRWFSSVEEWLRQGGGVEVWFPQGRAGDEALRHDSLESLRNTSWSLRHALEDHLQMEIAREAAIRVLGKIGPDATDAVPVLLAAVHDRNPDVAQAAAQALRSIGRGRGSEE